MGLVTLTNPTQRFRLAKLTGPTVEPVSTNEAREYLKVDDSTDDRMLHAQIRAVREEAEVFTRRSFLEQTWEMAIDGEISRAVLEVPRPPLISVTSIKYYSKDNTENTYGSSNYTVETSGTPGRVFLNDGAEWPSDLRAFRSIVVTYKAGFGTSPTAIPPLIIEAILRQLSHLYEDKNAEDFNAGNWRLLTEESKELLRPYQVARL